MARTPATLPEGSRITDYISLGVITKTFPLERVRAVLASSGKASVICPHLWSSITPLTWRCWDNAPMESFFGTLKTECLHHFKFKTRDHAKQFVFEYIEVFYNRIRRHVTIQNQVPTDYAQRFFKNESQIAA